LVALTNVAHLNNANKMAIVEQGGGRVAATVLNSPDLISNVIALQVK
jgi:hypothetical protein